MTAAAVLMLAAAGMVPLSLVSPSAHGVKPVPAGGAEAASIVVTAPTSFGRSVEPIPDELSAITVNHAPDQNVLNYRTHERMATSKSLGSPAVDDSTQKRSVADGNNDDSLSSTDPTAMTEPIAPVVDGGATPPARVKGKLFFDGYASDNACCTASVLSTPSKSVVITTAHCVYNAGEGWVKDAVLVPGYDRTQADPDPVEVWTVRSIRTFNSWQADQTDYSSNVAYVTLNNGGDANKPVVDVVGEYGLAWGGSYVFWTTIFGYPTDKTTPDGSSTVHPCIRTTEQSEGRLKVEGYDFGIGASGGPWFYRYNESTGLDYARSVTSLWRPLDGVNRGPYFTSTVKTMLDVTAGD